MWNRERQIDSKFRDVFKTFEGVTKRIEVLEKGRDVSAKLKGSGIQDCMKLITRIRADLAAHTGLLEIDQRWNIEQDEKIAALEQRIEALTQPKMRAPATRSVPMPGKAEGAMSHVTPSRFNYGTWDKGAMRHAENLRGIAATTTVKQWSSILDAAADFLEDTVAASEGSYK